MDNVNPKTRITPAQTLKNIEAYHAFTTMSDYKANNPDHDREVVDAAYAKLRAAEQNAVVTQAAAAAGVDALIAARREFHGSILGVKSEAIALYGPNSDQVAALGLKKKSEQAKKKVRKPKE